VIFEKLKGKNITKAKEILVSRTSYEDDLTSLRTYGSEIGMQSNNSPMKVSRGRNSSNLATD
jgi:hypothetical protein